jgi:hypothetical protein
MLEKHRLTYLEHLGIENYMPRRVLSHALASVLLPDDVLCESAIVANTDRKEIDRQETDKQTHALETQQSYRTESEQVATSTDNVEQVAAVRASVVSKLVIVEKPVDNVAPLIADPVSIPAMTPAMTTQDKPSGTQPIRFSLSVWRISKDLTVIDSRQPGSALPTDKLLQNMLRSIGYHLAQLPQSELLRWPLFKDDKLNSNEDEARAMVQAYLSALFSKDNTTEHATEKNKAIILLGKEAIRFSIDVGGDVEHFYAQHKGSALLHEQWKNQILIAPSLTDMLQDPMQKRVAWQALQTLLVSE